MKIIEYEDKYLEDVKNLLVELEEYILSIDQDNLDRLHEEYHDKMVILDLEEVNENNGKCYLAIENNKVIGKENCNYKNRSGVCLETGFLPDSMNQPNFVTPLLKAGNTYSTTTIYKFI